MSLREHTILTESPLMVLFRTIFPTLLMITIVSGNPLQAQIHTSPICQNNSDPDGDGWGWENNQSCRISNTFSPPSQPNTSSSASGAAVQQCIDLDGDGYGWNGSTTCTLQQSTTPGSTESNAECIDSDGDGFGWDGSKTCLVQSGTGQSGSNTSTAITAVNDTGTVVNGTAVLNVLANDLGNVDQTSVALYTPLSPSKGQVQINSRTGVITYIPYAGTTGTDTFGYTVRNTNNQLSNVATVTVAVGFAPEASGSCNAPIPKNKTVSVLLVGNSLMNDVQSRLRDLLDCGGYNSELATSNPGGHWLHLHNNTAATTNLIARGYDLTLLQEQSGGITTNVPPYTVINSLKNRIEAAGSEMGFYQTWGYQHRDPIQTDEILSGYENIANDFNAPIVHIGRAWDYFYTSHNENPPFSLYLDYAHPTNEGKALIAYVLYAYLTHESPVGLSYFQLSEYNAQLLQSLAWESYHANRLR